MKLNEYSDKAMSTRLPSAGFNYSLLGLAGEVGELFSLYAKGIRDDEGIVDNNLAKKELGDILWFIAALAKDSGSTLEEIAQMNLDKLQKRKKDKTLQGSGDFR